MSNVAKVRNKMKMIMASLCMVLCLQMAFSPMTVFASGEAAGNAANGNSNQYDISWLGGEGNGAFESLEKQVQETGNSAYRLFLAIGVVGLVLSIVICGLSIVVSGGGNKRSEKLGWLLWIGIGGVVIFGAMSIVSVLQSIGGNIM